MDNPHAPETQEPQQSSLPDPHVGLTPDRMRAIVEAARVQPAWRATADKCCDYYDGKQLTPEQIEELEPLGLGELIANFVKPTVNALLGLEAKLRTDWRVTADADQEMEMAEAISAKLNEAERESRADQACSEAYASMIKSGVGWTYVGRADDPFGYKYQVDCVHRNEIWWDWNARKPDLSDADWLMRERRDVSTEKVIAFYPEHEALIRAAAGGWSPEWVDLAQRDKQLQFAFDAEAVNEISWDNWRDIDGRTVTVREIWYREHKRGQVMTLPDGRVVVFDPENQIHAAALMAGAVQPREAVYSVWRVTIWIGPHKLMDEDWGTKRLPYVPWWGYREDRSKVPYGMIRDQVPMQDEINARRRKLMWLLSAKRAQIDSDALDKEFNDFSDLEREISRPDAILVTNPNRRNANGIKIENDLNLSTQQYNIMMESQDAIQRVAGVFNSMLGATDGAKSGTAITQLVDQGTTGQGDLNDNARFARTQTGQLLAELVVEDLTGQEIEVHVGSEGQRKAVRLNTPQIDPLTGLEYRENDVSKLLVKVGLQDIPSTPAYRAQAQTMMAEVLKSMPPQLQAVLAPFFLEQTDLPKRREMADTARKVLGLDQEGAAPDPEKQQMAEAMQQMQQMLAQMQEQLQGATQKLASKEGELAIKQRAQDLAERKFQALEAPKVQADVGLTNAQTLKTRADTAATVIDTQRPPPAPAQAPAPQFN